MLRRSCSIASLLGLNGRMSMRRSWSRLSSHRLPRKQTLGISTRSSQHRRSPSHHLDKMTAWSRSTANRDLISHTSPTQPVDQPNQPRSPHRSLPNRQIIGCLKWPVCPWVIMLNCSSSQLTVIFRPPSILNGETAVALTW